MIQMVRITGKFDSNKELIGIEQILHNIIVDHINDIVFIMKVETGPKFRYVFANHSAMLHAKLKENDMGSLLEDVLTEDMSTMLQAKYEELLTVGDTIKFQDSLTLNVGTKVINESVLTAIKDEGGNVQYVVSITRDITSATEEKRELEQAKERYKSIIEHNMDAVFTLNLEGDIVDANDAGTKLTLFTKEELKGKNSLNLFSNQNSNLIKKSIKQTLEGNSSTIDNCLLKDRTETEKIVQLRSIPIVVEGVCVGIYMIAKDVTVHHEQTELIHYMSLHDHLTGLWNRKALDEHVPLLINHMEENNTELSVIYIDLDRFKFVNDTLGLQGGDLFLKKVTNRLKGLTNDDCLLYRQGGDEFIFLLKNSSFEKTEKCAETILELFKKPFCIRDQEFYISPSMGISQYPSDGYDSNSLIQKATQALFQVKKQGKGNFRFFQTHMKSSFPNYMIMEAHLRRAIEKKELYLHYQPQVNLESGEMESLEALIRWENRKFGFVSPAQFIPLAEETGLIYAIGEWVLEQVCIQLQKWRKRGHTNVRVAINISPKQFLKEGLVNTIQYYLQKYDLPPANLEIEITEGAMQDTEQALKVLEELKQLGVYISVDDFGTGYSSLNYLKRFPIDILKIDQSFVREIQLNKKDAAITMTIIHLAHSLGLEVIAEGVEQEEQMLFLKDARCQKAQGYYFSKPISAEEIDSHLGKIS
jgi:diguanylate cyclase (GGDEF)-like protein/PAS domain S-box-containing protein